MLYIHKSNQLLIYCESTSPKQRSKIINLDGNKNHKPSLFLEKFKAIQDRSVGNIMETDMFEESLFLNENGNTLRILDDFSLEDRLNVTGYETLNKKTKTVTCK
jgi:hypothetical protein